jgi:hypothetical protein
MRRILFSALLLVMLGLGGCSLVVDFDRSLLLDAGPDGGVDISGDAGDDRSADEETESASSRGSDAG